jgi:oxidoreductase
MSGVESKTETEPQTSSPAYTAVVMGGTGAIGREVCATLVEDASYKKIVALSRREINSEAWLASFPSMDTKKAEARFSVAKIDYEKLEKRQFEKYDAVFCCLGTTKGDAGSDAARRKVDLDYVVNFVEQNKSESGENCGKVFALVSSAGASRSSSFEYMKLKGDIEAKMKEYKFPRLSIWRPGLLDRKDKSRMVEKVRPNPNP